MSYNLSTARVCLSIKYGYRTVHRFCTPMHDRKSLEKEVRFTFLQCNLFVHKWSIYGTHK